MRGYEEYRQLKSATGRKQVIVANQKGINNDLRVNRASL